MHASERASILAELTPPFTLLRPETQLSPVVFCSPHSGRIYPKAFLEASRLDAHTLRKSEDCYVDELFEPVVGLGAPLIAARLLRPQDRLTAIEKHPEEFASLKETLAPFRNAAVEQGDGYARALAEMAKASLQAAE